MKKFFLFISIIILCSIFLQAQNTSFILTISKDIHNTSEEKFLAHSGDGAFDSYLIQNLPFLPVKALYQDLEKKLNTKLISRGEAHITVITPVEYYNVLKSHISIQEIDKIAKDMKIQEAPFKIVCLGRGQTIMDKEIESTYYIVVEAKRLIEIRKAIWEIYVSKGGNQDDFNPDYYYPHITVGFTKRDLHESDGVIKDKNSHFACIVEE